MAEAKIRPATTEDAPWIAKVHVDTWLTSYAGIIAEDFLDRMSYERTEKAAIKRITSDSPGIFELVAEINDRIVGFAAGGPCRNEDLQLDGEIYALYILKEYQGKGIGRMLVQESARRLLAQGMKSMAIRVLAENPARGFYERMGGKLLSSNPIKIGDREYEEVAYGWDDIRSIVK